MNLLDMLLGDNLFDEQFLVVFVGGKVVCLLLLLLGIKFLLIECKVWDYIC